MNQASQHKMYNQTKIATANPGTLLIMLYDGAIKFLRLAVNAIDEKDIQTANNNIIRAEAVIVELMTSLKMDVGGEISKNLFQIYDYIYHTLVEANTKKDKQKIETVVSMLENMKKTWQEVIKKEAGKSGERKTEGIPKGLNIAV